MTAHAYTGMKTVNSKPFSRRSPSGSFRTPETVLLLHRCRQSPLDRPSGIEAHLQRVGSESDARSPIRHRHSLAAVFQDHVPAVIARLRVRCRPTTVRRRVWAVIVDAIQFVQRRRLRTHVCIELRERRAPCITHGDASASVARPRMIAGVIAARFGSAPRFMFRGIAETMLRLCRSRTFSLQTSAALSRTVSQGVAGDNRLISAIAETVPSRTLVCVAHIRAAMLDYESSESHARQVYQLCVCHGGGEW